MKQSVAALLLLCLLLGACRTTELSPVQRCLVGTTGAVAAVPAGPAVHDNQVLVSFRTTGVSLSATVASRLRQVQAAGLSAAFDLELIESRAGVLPDVVRADSDPESTAAMLALDPRVDWAIPNYVVHTLEADCATEQWHLNDFGVPAAWQTGPGRHDVVVAVIDSGIDVDHPELQEAMLPGFNFHDLTTDPRPGSEDDRHGTHVTGIIAARGHGQVAGVAGFPGTIRIVPIRIFDDTGDRASFDDLLLALRWAAGHDLPGFPHNHNPARLINLSLGARAGPQPGIDQAISDIVGTGVTVIAAAGNDPGYGIHAPANSAAAMAIGSVDSDYTRSWFSAFGAEGDLIVMAPGGSGPSPCGLVLSTIPGSSGVGCLAGTSMAAPFVTGALALLLSHQPELASADLQARLQAAAYFDPAFMTVQEYGAGVLCADRLLSSHGPGPGDRC